MLPNSMSYYSCSPIFKFDDQRNSSASISFSRSNIKLQILNSKPFNNWETIQYKYCSAKQFAKFCQTQIQRFVKMTRYSWILLLSLAACVSCLRLKPVSCTTQYMCPGSWPFETEDRTEGIEEDNNEPVCPICLVAEKKHDASKF